MKVCFVPRDFDGPGSYRMMFPMEQLNRNGYDVRLPPHHRTEDGNIHTTLLNSEMKKDVYGREVEMIQMIPADVFVFQMSLQQVMTQITLKLRANGKVVVGEADDDWLELTPDLPVYWGTGKHAMHNREHLIRTFMACDALTVSTPHLKESFERIHDNVHVLPNYLNWDMWKDVTPQYEVDRERVRIGWMGNSKLRPRDVALMGDFVGPFLEEHPEVDFVLAGNNPGVHDRLGVPDGQRVSYPAIPFRRNTFGMELDLPKITAVMDIGLVPLQLTEFNHSKSALKGMEYNACGIPFVASPTDSYKDWTEEGTNGFLASSSKQWREHLETLLDRETRSRMGESARRKARKFTIQRHWRKWAELYQRLWLNRVPYIPGHWSPSSARPRADSGLFAPAAGRS